jgi:hypothetical protein
VISRIRVIVRGIEGNPRTQYKLHRAMSRVWLACMVITVPVVIFAPAFWVKIGILLVAELSYYANWTGDQGAMAAANASTDDAITAYAIGEEAGEPNGKETP